jgi:hypothetical protein
VEFLEEELVWIALIEPAWLSLVDLSGLPELEQKRKQMSQLLQIINIKL